MIGPATTSSASSARMRTAPASRLRAIWRHLGRAAPPAPDGCGLGRSGPASSTAPSRTAAVEGADVRDRMLQLLDGGADSPLPVDPSTGVPDPAYLARIKAAMEGAAAVGDYR